MFEKEQLLNNYSTKKHQYSRRKSTRHKAKGIVVLTKFEAPIVTCICDIGQGGLSFFSTNEKDVTENEFKMDILLFEGKSDFEYFIAQVKGRVKSKHLVAHTESKAPIWRFGVEFLDLDSAEPSMLKACCSLGFD